MRRFLIGVEYLFRAKTLFHVLNNNISNKTMSSDEAWPDNGEKAFSLAIYGKIDVFFRDQ